MDSGWGETNLCIYLETHYKWIVDIKPIKKDHTFSQRNISNSQNKIKTCPWERDLKVEKGCNIRCGG